MINPNSPGKVESRKLVMIVDDEPDMLSMLRLVIEKKCACDVISAPSGIVALEQLGKCRPDVDFKRYQDARPGRLGTAEKNPGT